MASSTPTLAEVLTGAISSALRDVHTAIPGKVVRYDAAKQLADVQPLVHAAYADESGESVAVALPVVPNCPVQFSSGGGKAVTHPVAVGDKGLLVFSEASLDAWLARDGVDVDPGVDHRHNLTDGIFIPGVNPFGAPLAAVPSDAVGIGTPGGAYQGVAVGPKTHDALEALREWVADIASHAMFSSAPNPLKVVNSTPDVSSSDVKVT